MMKQSLLKKYNLEDSYRVNGKVVPDHVRLDIDVRNVNHWFNDKSKKK